MISKFLVFAALVAFAQAGVYELHHGEHGTSYSSVNLLAVPAVVKTAHVAPIAHVAPVFKVAPAFAKVLAPVVQKVIYPDTPAHYSFEYGVNDAHTGDVKNQHEERDGDVVKGYYTLIQPDGVTRTVHYTSDAHSGFNANVEYKGEPIVQKTVIAKAIVPAKIAVAAPVYHGYHH
ncbi:PREDICTED: cuticle protein 7-like [Nicrophorus vespilloides]|uniref:Cuticle protein 7-like n=1 Tax=Nicrophorus vespilloides TaxID=110193 RepID=A0ABM1ND12_NICVS|nr:PREDICTED: cuticle protein 7-like [Nicrophorus vespilloides]